MLNFLTQEFGFAIFKNGYYVGSIFEGEFIEARNCKMLTDNDYNFIKNNFNIKS